MRVNRNEKRNHDRRTGYDRRKQGDRRKFDRNTLDRRQGERRAQELEANEYEDVVAGRNAVIELLNSDRDINKISTDIRNQYSLYLELSVIVLFQLL